MLINYNSKIPPEDGAPYENGHVIHFAKKYASIVHRLDTRWNNSVSTELDDYVRHYTNALLHLRPGYVPIVKPRRGIMERSLSRMTKIASRIQPQKLDQTIPYRLLSLACTLIAETQPYLPSGE
jgi:hypothetical protein